MVDDCSFQTTLYDFENPLKPTPIGLPFGAVGERSGIVYSVGKRHFLITVHAVYAIGEKELKKYGDITPGFSYDGSLYHPAVEDDWVAIPSDWFVTLLHVNRAEIEQPK